MKKAPQPAIQLPLQRGAEAALFGCRNILYGSLGGFFLIGFIVAFAARLGLGVGAIAIALILAMGLVGLFIAWLMRRTVYSSVAVGSDGIVIKQWRRRFVPYSEVVRYSVQVGTVGEQELVIDLQRGRVAVRIDTLPEEQRAEVLERLKQGIRDFRRDEEEESLTILDRRGRTLSEWNQAMHTVWLSEDYRQAPLTIARVKAALANSAAPPERRIGAALALLASDEPGASDFVRRQSDACAEPTLRNALAAVAAGSLDEDALGAVLGYKDRVRIAQVEDSDSAADAEREEQAIDEAEAAATRNDTRH